MNAQLHSKCVAFWLCFMTCTLAVAETGTGEKAQGGSSVAAAAASCEAAVTAAIREARGADAQKVEFVGAKRTMSPTTPDELGVKGEGSYLGPSGSMPFTYSCAFNSTTNETTGVLFSEKGVFQSSAQMAWQPDLTHLSPEACEAATAAALKDMHPRVGKIMFGSDSRQLKPGPNGNTSMEGKGGVERATGMHSVPFTYRCEFDGASGKIVGVQTSLQ